MKTLMLLLVILTACTTGTFEPSLPGRAFECQSQTSCATRTVRACGPAGAREDVEYTVQTEAWEDCPANSSSTAMCVETEDTCESAYTGQQIP